MPRRPRTHIDNVPLHIVQRGHNREPCFFAEEDYHSYLHWLGLALKEAGCRQQTLVVLLNHSTFGVLNKLNEHFNILALLRFQPQLLNGLTGVEF